MTMSLQATVSAEVYLANGQMLLQGQDTGHAKFLLYRERYQCPADTKREGQSTKPR